jgi:hypothetical protein
MSRIEEEVFRLKYETLGERDIGRLRDEIRATEKHLAGLAEGLKRGAMGQEYFNEQLVKAARALAPLRAELAGYERAAARAAAGAKAAADATEDASEKATASKQGFANAGNAVFQMANLMEDAQFGARGLANNIGMLAGSMFNFHPIAMAVGGVLQVLTAVFKDQIDAVLAQAGILDENLVKGMDKAKDATEGLADAQKNLLATMPGVTVGIKDQVQQIGELLKALDGTQARRLMEQGALDETGYRSRDVADALKQVEAMREEVRKVDVPGPERDRQVSERMTWLRAAEKKLAEITADRQQFAQDRVARQIAAAGSSDQAALDQAQRLRNLSEKTGNEDLANMAGALERLTQTFRDFETQAADQAAGARGRIQQQERDRQLVEALLSQGDDNKEASDRLVERLEKDAQAEREKAAAANDLRLGGMYQGLGGSLEQAAMGRLMAGQSPEDIGAALMGQVEATGVGSSDAFSLVVEAIKQAQEKRAAMTREQAIQLQEWMRQQLEMEQQLMREAMRAGSRGQAALRMWNRQNTFFNNRPDGF